MLALALTLHLLGTIVWVGGMFFAHMAMRPALEELLEPPQRLPLLKRILDRFFRWVWLSVVLVLVTGFWIFLGVYQGQMGLYVHIMTTLGLVMALLFSFIYLVPYKRMGRALDDGDVPAAGGHMVLIRRIIAINLVLGLVTSVLGVAKLF
jgi:uncharacterized membrane protein